MARIILGSWFVRYPLGGNLSCVLQYLVGFQRLGHEVYFVEKNAYPDACYDLVKNVMSDDCTYGITVVNALLTRFGLQDRWCFVDAAGYYHGLPRERIEAIFQSADLFIEMGTHEAWLVEAADARLRILMDGDPGFSQMWMEQRLAAGEALPSYDYYYTVGQNVGTCRSTAPTAGKLWRHFFHPVVTNLFASKPAGMHAPFTTVMNWQSYSLVEFNGVTYGHKNMEFEKFIYLPSVTDVPLEIAVSGRDVPADQLRWAGWRVQDAHAVTQSYESFVAYLQASRGEFTVCKHGFIATQCGWFGDRSAVYLASGRPVVMQDTGFSHHLPCGRGLFAVRTLDEAAAAIDEINADYQRHSNWAHEIAVEYLDASKLLGRILNEIGL